MPPEVFNFQKYNSNAITTGSLRAYWKIQAPWEEMPVTLGLRPRVIGISSLGAWIFQCALSDPVVISQCVGVDSMRPSPLAHLFFLVFIRQVCLLNLTH